MALLETPVGSQLLSSVDNDLQDSHKPPALDISQDHFSPKFLELVAYDTFNCKILDKS